MAIEPRSSEAFLQLNISGVGVLDIARGHGLEVHRAESLENLTDYIRKGEAAAGPRLVEILER